MNRWERWRDGLPLWAFFSLFFVFYTAAQLAVGYAETPRGMTIVEIVIRAVGGLVAAGIVTAVIAWRRRRAGGASTFREINQAVHTGRLPENAEPAVWGPELQRRRSSYASARFTGPALLGLFALLAIVLLVTGTDTVLAAVMTVAFVGLGVYTLVSSNRYLARVESLQRALDPRVAPDAEPRADPAETPSSGRL